MFFIITKQILKAPLSRHSSLLAIPRLLYFLPRYYIGNTSKKLALAKKNKEREARTSQGKGEEGERGKAKEKPVKFL